MDEVRSGADLYLDVNTCWALVRGVAVGRLAVIVDAHPEIFPVNHVVDHGTVVFRTADGTKLSAALAGADVAFEADGLDPDTNEAWSVVLKGRAEEVRDLDDVLAASELPLTPWHGSAKHRFVRIEPTEITGRRFAVVDPVIWSDPFRLRRAGATAEAD